MKKFIRALEKAYWVALNEGLIDKEEQEILESYIQQFKDIDPEAAIEALSYAQENVGTILKIRDLFED